MVWGDRSVTFIEQHTINQARSKKLSCMIPKWIAHLNQPEGKPTRWSIVACGPCYHERTFFSRWGSVVHLWKSNKETHIKNSQSWVGLVAWQNQFGPQDPNQTCWHQRTTRWHVSQKQLYTWRVEPSSSFGKHQIFLNNFLQLFTIFFLIRSGGSAPRQRESSGKRPEREIGSGKAEANACERLSQAWGKFVRKSPGESKFGPERVSDRSWKQSAKEGGQSLRKAEARVHQYADLQLTVLGESLQDKRKKWILQRRATSTNPST